MNTTDNTDITVERAAVDIDADRKRYLTLQARAALAGCELVLMADGGFVIGRWGLVKSLADAAEVEAFLVRVGALK